MANYVFPLELREADKNWPFVSFIVNDKDRDVIHLPIPPGITFGDSMNYSSIDLGILNAVAVAGAQAALDTSGPERGMARKAGKSVGAMVTAMTDKISKVNVAAGASIAARALRQDDKANVIDFAAKQVLAPNTNTTFNSASVRSFQFAFKMIGKTADETRTIKNITQLFQEKMYPEGDDVVLAYPPTWRIIFHDGNGRENAYIPGIYSCYLTSGQFVFNGNNSIFHEDGSPVEADITISFQETKALTRGEIFKLNKFNNANAVP